MTADVSDSSMEPMENETSGNDEGARKAAFGKTRHKERRCVGTGQALAPEDPALRFVLSPAGEVVLDLKGSLPGRGVWLTPDRKALLGAVSRGGFQRGFKKPAALPNGQDAESFADQLEAQLAQAALGRLGLCRKASTLVAGQDKVRQKAGRGLAYLTPRGASEAETVKMASLLAKTAGLPHLPLPADRLVVGAALGQDGVHLLLLRGGPSAGALEKVQLWRQFCGDSRH